VKKLIIITVVLAATFAAGTAQAGIFGRRYNRGPAVQPAPAVAAPIATTTAQTDNGYRAFSYQPAPVSVAPAAGYAVRQTMTASGFHDAGWKARGL
jgi:hypothetical protein